MEIAYGLTCYIWGIATGALIASAVLTAKWGGKAKRELGLKIADKAAADPEFAKRLDALFLPPPPPKPSGEPVRVLGLLQRDARLIDFLMENIAGYSDDQIGSSVRTIHAGAQAVLKKHFTLEAVLPQSEGERVTVPSGFDPSAIRLTGNIGGKPPFNGTLQHAGWRVKKIDLPKPAEGVDEFVLMPAEVEVV